MNEQDRRPIDSLIDRERIRGASRMIPEGTEAAEVTQEQIDTVISDVETFCRAHKISRKQLGDAAGYSSAVISEFMSGRYAGKKGQVAIDLENWLVEEEGRRQRPATTTFTWTNVALQIKSVANYCLDYRKIGLVYGPDTAGIGKTMALQAIHQELGPRRTSLVTIDKVDQSPTAMLSKIARAIRVEASGTTKRRFDLIIEKLKSRSHLLMIDQIHNLRGSKDDKSFYILADLYDATQSAQLWCGTADLVGYLNRQRVRTHDESLAQIRRRIFPCVDLMEMLASGGEDGKGQPLVTIEQIREMFAKNKLKITAAAAKFLFSLINRPDTGGVGLCAQLIEYATMLGEMNRCTSIDVPLIKAAMRHGITSARADNLVQDIEDNDERNRKVG